MSARLVCWPPSEACAKGMCRQCRTSRTFKSRNQIARASGVNRWSVAPQPWRPRVASRVVALEPDPTRPIGQWRKPKQGETLVQVRNELLDDIEALREWVDKATKPRRRPRA